MSYVFDSQTLEQITNRHLDLPLDQVFDAITKDLDQAYPGRIYTGPRRWVFNNAGGAMGQMTLLHASLSEYIIFFGTPLGTQGHSGRYPTRVYDFMIRGEVWTWIEGQLDRTVSTPGVNGMDLPPGVAKGYRAFEDAWMLEYARGPIPLMLPFGLWDTIFSTLDVVALAKTVAYYTQLTFGQLLKGKI
ncbi:ERG2 family protein [bacterium]|nr:ERG2 family protein [bacterium]